MKRIVLGVVGYAFIVLAAPVGYLLAFVIWTIFYPEVSELPIMVVAIPAILVAGVGYVCPKSVGFTADEYADRAYIALAEGGVVAGLMLFL